MIDEPYWSDTAPFPRFPAVATDTRVDVAIVGGGIMGLTAAFLLKQQGTSVAVFERDRCASADTGHTSAHLTWVTDTRLKELVSTFGRDHAQAVHDAGAAAIAQIETIIGDLDIDCDFEWVPGYLHARPGEKSDDSLPQLREEAELARSMGFDAAFVEDVPGIGAPGVRFETQARFHPRKYLAALARAIDGDGSHVFEHSAVDSIEGEPPVITVGSHRISASRVIVATHNPIVGTASAASATFLQTKLALYTSYVVGGLVAHGRLPDALYWDLAPAYRYIRVQPDVQADLIVFGGEDHKTGQVDDTAACYERLERTAREYFPGIELTHRWSGQVIETSDGLPFIGPVTSTQFSGTGFSGNGLTFGTVAAMMAADWVQARANPWTDLFDINRIGLRGGLWDYIKENKDYPYYLLRDKLVGPDATSLRTSLRSIRRGDGKIVDVKGQRMAAYRSPRGVLTLLSPTCTHLGCQVAWNEADSTWDCPCHGSRFKPHGQVLSGPAESPLPELHVRR